jgi:adenine-specific DNA methylase
MSEEITNDSETEAPEKVAIEGRLPLTAIDIESQKDMKSGRHHKLRSLHKWFAARPTPAARVSILASVYPGEIDPDKLLRLMQVGPKARKSDIAAHVERKFSESRNGSKLDDHYGYPNPNTQSPTAAELESFHDTVAEGWGGELPTVLDPTAGRGIIPFESMRYGFESISNELNPVAYLITKVGLEFVQDVGSLDPEIYNWRDKIHAEAKENIEKYYPTQEPERQILNSAVTYLINCDACQGDIPLTTKWWINREYGKDAIKPIYHDGIVDYNHIKMNEYDSDDFDPSDGPVARGGDTECPHCGVVHESDRVQEKVRDGDLEYSVYGVSYETPSGDWKFRAGSDVDSKGMEKAAERIESDFDLIDFLTQPISHGEETERLHKWGMSEWRDIFTPRQLVVHYEYLQAYKKFEEKIREKHEKETAKAILTILSLSSSRAISFSSRLVQWHEARGCAGKIFSDNNFAVKRMFGDNNLAAPRRGYIARSDQIIESYEELTKYNATGRGITTCLDAGELAEQYDEGSVDVAVVDPPYYTSIMYSELSEVFYAIQNEYLGNTYPELYSSKLPEREDEAVANPSRFDEVASETSKSRDELAKSFYEDKMRQIFSQIYELLSQGGVLTVMFTHRDMDAWDTLTTALIDAGFTITSTHPIKTEMGDRIAMQDNASADSSILLVARKRTQKQNQSTSLWEDISKEFYSIAEREAKEILSSQYTISKTDTAIAVYGPTLQRFAEEYPVVNKKGDKIRPRKALSEAQKAVTSVLAERFLKTKGIEKLDSLTRWYILAWLIYENDTFPYDEGRQLGVAAGIDIDDIKRPTKIWRGGKEIELQKPSDRIQDVVLLRNDSVDNPSTRKYPVDPTDKRFTYTIDAVHSAIHIYERDGPKGAWDWLTQRNLKSNDAFEVAVTALLEVLPEDGDIYQTLVDMISGETGEYLDINVDHIDMSGVDRQTSLGDHN